MGCSGSFAEVFDGKDTGSDSAELLEEFSCVSGRATGMGSGSGTIEDRQLVSLVGEKKRDWFLQQIELTIEGCQHQLLSPWLSLKLVLHKNNCAV